MTKYALITAIEGNIETLNKQCGITSENPRMFEQEAILCFQTWRKNAGWLKDIPIYAFCPTQNVISFECQSALEDLGVRYIEHYDPIVETFTSGFLNVPLIASKLERILEEDVLIKTDLDMTIIKQLPRQMVNSVLENDLLVCGQYDDYSAKNQRTVSGHAENPFDTGFTISSRESMFYNFYYKKVMETLGSKDPGWLEVKAQSGEYFLEEYVMDKIYHERLWNIAPIQKYQIGEWYTPITEFTDEELQNVYFWHEHYVHDAGYDKTREKIEYFKRMKKL